MKDKHLSTTMLHELSKKEINFSKIDYTLQNNNIDNSNLNMPLNVVSFNYKVFLGPNSTIHFYLLRFKKNYFIRDF